MNDPNICTIYEIGEQDGHWFIAMELQNGRTLDRVMTRPVPMQQLVEWSIQISDALDLAHRQGIVHRDLKPSNIFVTERRSRRAAGAAAPARHPTPPPGRAAIGDITS